MSLLRLTANVRRSSALRAVCACGLLVAALAATQARADSAAPLAGLVDAAAQRLQVAEPVAAVKWHTHGLIEDPDRVQQVLADMRADAAERHLDADYVARVFGDQIDATEAIEYRRFADWKLTPSSAPADSPDLAASRSAIDGFNQTMLTQLAANWDVLHSPQCPAQLDTARSGVARARHLDGLYQQALTTATKSYCA
ncbi:chorismate mutase [Mycobacterium rhizamassiliense]|jgi:chorismate mutase|uniref:Chorismate mutase n=1 Tax=Mycobacterium rhizamassiliense TaxID=1841860 RepID=A0A2U3NYP2_9MYCO|nr:chorismate mutase [Mycobacterium rhizamassiliense]SPM36630.1 chorismate mutase [Mycobacterium rhizamassiliense]